MSVEQTFEAFVRQQLATTDAGTPNLDDAAEAIIARHHVYATRPGKYPDDRTSRDLIACGLAVAHLIRERTTLPATAETWLLKAADKWKQTHTR